MTLAFTSHETNAISIPPSANVRCWKEFYVIYTVNAVVYMSLIAAKNAHKTAICFFELDNILHLHLLSTEEILK